MSKSITYGAALTQVEKYLGRSCTFVESFPAIPITSATLKVNNSPDRIGLLMINVGSVDAYIGTTSQITTAQGIYMPANGGVFEVDVRNDFILPSLAWYFVSAGSAGVMYVLETIALGVGV